jgi:chromosome segregation ATPase
MPAPGPAPHASPSIEQALARLEALRVRADELIGDRPSGAGPASPPPSAAEPPRPSAPALAVVRDEADAAPSTVPDDPGRVAAQIAAARAEIEILRGDVDRAREAHESESETLRAEHVAKLEAARAEHAAKLEEAREEHASVARELARERDTAAALGARVDELSAEAERLLAQRAERESTFAAELAALQASLDAEAERAEGLASDLRETRRTLEEERVARTLVEAEIRAEGEQIAEALRAELVATREDTDALSARFAAEADRVAERIDELERLSRVLAERAEAAERERDAAVTEARNRIAATERERDHDREALLRERAETTRLGEAHRQTDLARQQAVTEAAQAVQHVAELEARLGERLAEVGRLQSESRATHDALVGAQRQVAEAQVQLATLRQDLDRERLARGESDARIALERTDFEERLRATEFSGRQALEAERGAHAAQREKLAARIQEAETARETALAAERDHRRVLQEDLQGKLDALREELGATTQSLRNQLAQERSTLEARVRELEARVAGEAEAASRATRDRDELAARADALEAAIAQARDEADASRQRCVVLEQEIARRDEMLKRVTSIAGDLRGELEVVRGEMAAREGSVEALGGRAQELAARAAALVEQARAVRRPLTTPPEAEPEAPPAATDAIEDPPLADADADAEVEAEPPVVTEDVSGADERGAHDEPRRVPNGTAGTAPGAADPEVRASLDELVERIERLKAQVPPVDAGGDGT